MNDLFINDTFFNKKLDYTIGFRVDEDLHNKVFEFSNMHGLPVSEVVRLVLMNYFYGDDDL